MVRKKLVKHATDYIALAAMACQQAAQQQNYALTAVSSQVKLHCYIHDTCMEGAALHCLHLMPAG